MNIMITGGVGFVGSHMVDAYLKSGNSKIVVIDNLSCGSLNNISAENRKQIQFHNLDIVKDHEEIDQIVKREKIDLITHLAAELEVSRGIQDSIHDASVNTFGTLNMLNSAIHHGVSRFVFASSGSVYGQAKKIPQAEGEPLEPHWPYGVSKLAAEKYCEQYRLLYGLSTISFRYGIVYGPREWYGRVLTMFLKRALEGKPLIIFGSGKQTRDFVHVQDVIRAHMIATENPKTTGVFNLGTGVATSIKQLAETITKVTGSSSEIIFDNPQEGKSSHHQPERIRLQGELSDFVLDSKKAEKQLGWNAKIQLAEGLATEAAWLKQNQKAWEKPPRV